MISEFIRDNKTIVWVWALSLLFVLVNAVFVLFGIFTLPILPVALLLVMLAFFRMDKILLLILFFVPLSIPLSFISKELPVDLSLPSEPLLALVMFIFFLKYMTG